MKQKRSKPFLVIGTKITLLTSRGIVTSYKIFLKKICKQRARVICYVLQNKVKCDSSFSTLNSVILFAHFVYGRKQNFLNRKFFFGKKIDYRLSACCRLFFQNLDLSSLLAISSRDIQFKISVNFMV